MKLNQLLLFVTLFLLLSNLLKSQQGYAVIGLPAKGDLSDLSISSTVGQIGFRQFKTNDLTWNEGLQHVLNNDVISVAKDGSYDILLPYGNPMVLDILKGNTLYTDAKIVIVNRWGQKVFEQQPYQNDWFGQGNNGQILPDGAYFFVLTLDVANDVKRLGSVTVIR